MMTTATDQQSTPPIYCGPEDHGLGYGCALCLGTNRNLSGYIEAAQYSGGWGVVGEPSSGYPDHDQAPAGSVIDPTYTSRITWVDGEPVVTGDRPGDDSERSTWTRLSLGNDTLTLSDNPAPSDAEWVPMPSQAKARRAHHYGPRPYWLRKLDFDVLAYLEQQWASRLQWQADPRLAESPTTAEGLEDAWPGEVTVPVPSPQERKRRGDSAKSLIGYRSAARQYTLA